MTRSLEGKMAIVTGGGSGIGRAAARLFVRDGAKVVVADINAKGGEETVQMIAKEGGEALFVKTDVSKAAEVEAMVNKTVETFGQLDCAFNNAGISGELATIIDCTEENWDRVINNNLRGVWLCMKYEIPEMLKQDAGAIVNTTSQYGQVGYPNLCAYTASKHGIIGLTKVAALEYAEYGLRVNAVIPGNTRTPMLAQALDMDPAFEAMFIGQEPIGRLADPEEIAEAVVWLCSDAASFVTGSAMAVDGGYLAQ
jgi:NAD(P)-dependent dehydrogenase (short-subunit alcohol dehydrogenase family)